MDKAKILQWLMWLKGKALDFVAFVGRFVAYVRRQSFRNLYITFVAVFVVSLLLISGQRYFFGKVGNFFRTKSSAQVVEVSKATKKLFAEKVSAVGTLISVDSVMVTPEVTGTVEEIYFNEGQAVKKDEPLIKIESTAYEAQVEIARANLELSRLNSVRNAELFKGRVISKQTYDESQANFRKDQASLTLALDNYQKTLIRAPFDGVIGLKAVSMGMYIRPGDKIANIENIKSLQVDFQLPEKFLDKITPGMKVEVTSDAYPTKAFDGQIIALDPAINSINRTIKIRANLDNREELLRPGSFARVNVNYNVRESVTIPEMGLIKNQEGNTAFIIREATEDDMKKEKTRKASRDFFSKFFEEVMFKDMMIEKEPVFFIRKADIKIGNRSDDEVEIIEGIQEGEQVVTAGHQKIYQDKTVKIRGNK